MKRMVLVATMLLPGAAQATPRDVDLVLEPQAEMAWATPLWRAMPSPSGAENRAWFESELGRRGTDEEEEEDLDEETLEAEADAAERDAAERTAAAEEAGEAEADALEPASTVTIGTPSQGWLIAGVRLERTDRVWARERSNWGTVEMVDAIRDAVDAVHEQFPGSPPLAVGDLSRDGGGPFKPHRSHQSGRDADIGYYHKSGARDGLALVSPATLDAARTWTFLAALIEGGNTEMVFIDYRLQKPLYEYARKHGGVPEEKLARIFQFPRGKRARALITHLKGHADHMHVRFRAPRSQLAAKAWLEKHGTAALKPVPEYYKVRPGDTLGRIARKFRVALKDLTRWNGFGKKKLLHPEDKLIVGWRRPRLPSH